MEAERIDGESKGHDIQQVQVLSQIETEDVVITYYAPQSLRYQHTTVNNCHSS